MQRESLNMRIRLTFFVLLALSLASCNAIERGIEDSLYVLPWNWGIGNSIKEENLEQVALNPNSRYVATAIPMVDPSYQRPEYRDPRGLRQCIIGNNPLLRLAEYISVDYVMIGNGARSSIQEAKDTAVRNCVSLNNGEACMVVVLNGTDICDEEKSSFIVAWDSARQINRANIAAQHQREQERSISQENAQRQSQCKAFGFTDDTPEMANCLLELYKIANQPQQNTVITNSAPARTNSSDTTSGIELMNRGLQILNGVGTPSAPSSRTSTCTRIGDISGQVVTFNNIACPAGYVPTF